MTDHKAVRAEIKVASLDMLVMLLINVIVLIIGAVFSWLPQIDTIPMIMDYDIDTALLTGVGQFKMVIESFWVYGYLFGGLVILLGYYSIKMLLRFFLGHRSPGS